MNHAINAGFAAEAGGSAQRPGRSLRHLPAADEGGTVMLLLDCGGEAKLDLVAVVGGGAGGDGAAEEFGALA